MITNYLKIAVRGLLRRKGHSVINIAGLALGMICAFVIGAYVWHELHYDRQWNHADRIYRVVTDSRTTDSERHIAGTPVPLGAALRNEIPEAEQVARFWQAYQPVLRLGDYAFREEGVYFADPAAFDIFNFSFLRGTSTALNAPRSVVLTESFARKYFGDADPIGKTLEYDGFPEGKLSLTVTGVLADLPSSTALRFDALISINGVTTEIDNWGSTKDIWTYVLFRRGTNVLESEAKLGRFAEAHFGKPDPRQRTLHFQPLREVHLDARYDGGFSTPVSRSSLTLASLIGVSILLLACINFTNLTTARALTRSRDMGVRKVLGARRWQLIVQVLGEIFLLAIVASSIALVAVELLGPMVESFADTTIEIPWWMVAMGVGAITVSVTVIAGGYPALLLSGFDPIRVLAGRSGGRQRSTSRKVLVVTQFTSALHC